MNIFYTNNDPKRCAIEHTNKHLISQIKESCQLLSTAHHVLDGLEYVDDSSGRKIKRWKLTEPYESILYKATHINHPSAIWVRQSYENYMWLYALLHNLCQEYTHRYGKIHKCQLTGLVDKLEYSPFNIPVKLFTEPTPAMPEEYIVKGDSILSYQNYIKEAKKHLHTWTTRPTPTFIG